MVKIKLFESIFKIYLVDPLETFNFYFEMIHKIVIYMHMYTYMCFLNIQNTYLRSNKII